MTESSSDISGTELAAAGRNLVSETYAERPEEASLVQRAAEELGRQPKGPGDRVIDFG